MKVDGVTSALQGRIAAVRAEPGQQVEAGKGGMGDIHAGIVTT